MDRLCCGVFCVGGCWLTRREVDKQDAHATFVFDDVRMIWYVKINTTRPTRSGSLFCSCRLHLFAFRFGNRMRAYAMDFSSLPWKFQTPNFICHYRNPPPRAPGLGAKAQTAHPLFSSGR